MFNCRKAMKEAGYILHNILWILCIFWFHFELQCYSFVQSCGLRIRNYESDGSASLRRHHGVIVLHCMTLPNFTMKIFKAMPWGVQDETLSMVISFNVFIVRTKLNTRTCVDLNRMLYYSLNPFLYIKVSRHGAVCMPSKGTLLSVSDFKDSRNKTCKLGKRWYFYSTLYVFVHCSTKP